MIQYRGMPGLFDVPENVVLDALQLLEKCPQCGAMLIYVNPGNGTVDTYCEECGFPDENRAVAPAPEPNGLEGFEGVCLH